MTLYALPHVQELLPEAPGLVPLEGVSSGAAERAAADFEPEVRRRIAAYLAGATCVVAVGRREDPRHPERGAVVDFGVMSDGEWVWPAYWEYLVKECGVVPPAAFLEHVRARGFAPGVLSEAEIVAVDEARGDAVVVG